MKAHTKIIFILVAFGLVIGLGYFFFKKNIGSVKIPPREVVNLEESPLVEGLTLLPGYSIQLFSSDVPDARDIIFDKEGRMLVSQPKEGRISVLVDEDSDGYAEETRILVEGLNRPHGLAFKCDISSQCFLYVAEHDKLIRYTYNLARGTVSEYKKLADIDAARTDRHFTRSLLFLPPPNNNILLVSVGSSCNVCYEEGDQRGKILAYDVLTGTLEEYAKGLRNAVFMTLSPEGKVFATEMGRDGLGDTIPPDEINVIQKGANYGWPVCYGSNIHDIDFDKNTYIRYPCIEPTEKVPYLEIEAHSAPLGLDFTEEGDLLVALHGSWNRSTPVGYKVALYRKGSKEPINFVSGWLTEHEKKRGRPVDVLVHSNGIFISDDMNGAVYRVYKE